MITTTDNDSNNINDNNNINNKNDDNHDYNRNTPTEKMTKNFVITARVPTPT